MKAKDFFLNVDIPSYDLVIKYVEQLKRVKDQGGLIVYNGDVCNGDLCIEDEFSICSSWSLFSIISDGIKSIYIGIEYEEENDLCWTIPRLPSIKEIHKIFSKFSYACDFKQLQEK